MVELRPHEKPNNAAKAPVLNSASSDRPYVCPFAGCEKAYIHEYKLNLHLRKEHPGHNPEEGYKTALMTAASTGSACVGEPKIEQLSIRIPVIIPRSPFFHSACSLLQILFVTLPIVQRAYQKLTSSTRMIGYKKKGKQ
ncbi:uncharacterized protein LOC114578564 [Dendrobium catenatum]|uniref:uncharacterized protein LOC114578564 n=1 Tax=Dendrobium catenatum TaxID=906689 RepID=UPI00109EFE75|nr:uncharacterized protein LOC114578564 [Dendrobium catenatum]